MRERAGQTAAMDIGHILKSIFGSYPSVDTACDYRNFTLEDHVKQLNGWLKAQLHDERPAAEVSARLVELGCLGPAVKTFDVRGDRAHTVNVSKDWLTVQSQTAFSTVRANCCVFRGRWQFEVQLRSKGIMQIGWCSSKCQFTQDTGVGDTRNSYGLDGSKQRLWHVQTRKYGPYWRSGDIIGVCLDMDRGTIEYRRNGCELGEAFRDIERGAGIALFPAASMAYNDSITANFGGAPYRHPVEGYEPLQARPLAALHNADVLLQFVIALARQMSTTTASSGGGSGLGKTSTTSAAPGQRPSLAAVHMVVAGQLVGPLGKLLNSAYVIEDKVYAFVRSMCVLRSGSDGKAAVYPGSPQSTLGTFLTLLWTYLDGRDMKSFLGRFIVFLSSMYRETPADLDYEKQRTVVVILACLCHHNETRRYMLESRFFKKHCLPVFLYIKPPDESTLGDLLPDAHIWTSGIGGSKDKYMSACKKLQQSTDVLYGLQKNLVELLMRNDDHVQYTVPSSRCLFVHKMRRYVIENCLEQRSFDMIPGNYGTPTQPAVALSFLCIVLDVLQQKFAAAGSGATAPIQAVRPIHFYDGTLSYSSYDRLGGILSYLTKTYNQELLDRIGEAGVIRAVAESEARPTVPSELSIYSAMVVITGAVANSGGGGSQTSMHDSASATRINGQNGADANEPGSLRLEPTTHPLAMPWLNRNAMANGPMDEIVSLNDMLDSCIMYYYAVAHKYIVMIADLRDNIGLLSDVLLESKDTFNTIKRNISVVFASHEQVILNELNTKFTNRTKVFMNRSLELARKQVWYRAVALGDRRRRLLNWMLNGIFLTLTESSNDGVLFTFVPELYVNILPILLDTCLDFSHHDLAAEYPQTECMDTLRIGAEFLANHAADPRIVLASCKDSLLQALGTLTCHAAGMRRLEATTPGAQRNMVMGLLRPYENRAWGQSNWLLIRFWLGEGFAFRDARPPSVWQSAEQLTPEGLLRSRGKYGAHTGLLHHVAPSCPSKHYQHLVRDVLMNDEPFATIFMNSMLSQLNWAFSEFVLLLQEIANAAQRQDQRQLSESRSLKICAMCFELTVSLMRSLEMLITIAPQVCKNADRPNGDLLLNRICQLVSQVLARVTVPPGVFQLVVDLCLPDLTAVTHFAIITAAIGIVLALLDDELAASAQHEVSAKRAVSSRRSSSKSPVAFASSKSKTSPTLLTPSTPHSMESMTAVSRVSRILLTDPSFQIAHLEFALGIQPTATQANAPLGDDDDDEAAAAQPQKSRAPVVPPTPKGNFDPQQRAHIDPLTNEVRVQNQRSRRSDRPIVKFNLRDYASHVTTDEIAQLQRLIDMLHKHESIISVSTIPSDDNICPICYAKAVSAIFEPCKHQSCVNCIVQHLMNNKVCFYCKAQITKVANFDGVSIYECLASEIVPPPVAAD